MESRVDHQKQSIESMAQSLRHFFDEQYSDLRKSKADRRDFEASASKKDQEKLAEALSQSCQDLSASVMAVRREMSVLEHKCADLGQNVLQYREAVGHYDVTIGELKCSFIKQNQMIGDLEQQWARRFWGYQDGSNTQMPQSQHAAHQPARFGIQDGSKFETPPHSPKFETVPSSRSSSPCREASCGGQGTCSGDLAPWRPTSPWPAPPTLPKGPSSYRGNLAARLWGKTVPTLGHGGTGACHHGATNCRLCANNVVV